MPNGSVDTTFNGTGVIVIKLGMADPEENEAISIALQKDGKVLVCGAYVAGKIVSSYITRYNASGELDSSFNGGRPVVIESPDFGMISASTISVRDSDGTIVVVGGAYDKWSSTPSTETPWIAVLNSSGSFSLVFNNGKPLFSRVVSSNSTWQNCAWQEDGDAIFVSGTVVARYLLSGQLDLSFNGKGWNSVRNSYRDMQLTNDKKLALVGQASLLRYLT